MKKIFFILAVFAVLKYLVSVVLICKRAKGWSYAVEIAFSCSMFLVALDLEEKWYIISAAILGEYLISKLMVYINVIAVKKIAFRRLVSLIRQDENSKMCYKLKQLYQVDYGRKLKHGLPGMARQVHEKTGVKFDRNGFPKFKSYCSVKLKRKEYKESRDYHFYRANKILYRKVLKSRRLRNIFTKADIQALKNGYTPQDYTWHHHQKRGKMQLVLREVHSSVNHIGGYSIWGNGE